MILTLGTRGSKLSLIQSQIVADKLRSVEPDIQVNLKVIKTLGDKDRRKPLYQLNQKGIFEKEIDLALIRREVDFAVHSLKDVPETGESGLVLAAVPERESPNDVLVSRSNLKLEQLPSGATVGTSSLRRMAQVKRLKPDLEVKAIRGNEESRVAKVDKGEVDAAILAEAGLKRLGLSSRIAQTLSLEDFPPAAGQGALAVVARKEDSEVLRVLSRIDHYPSRAEVLAERALISELHGGCRVPIGTIGRANKESLSLYGSTYSVDGKLKVDATLEGDLDAPEQLGAKLAHQLIERGAKELVEQWRSFYEQE